MEENKNIEPEQHAENIPEVEQSEIPPLSGEISPRQLDVPETEEQPTTNLSTEALPAGQASSSKVDDKLQTKEMETHAQHLHHAPGKNSGIISMSS